MIQQTPLLKRYIASAGSGKTYTLAKEYIKIVLLNPYHYKKILAVTFTKKATEEMKTRIVEFLSELKQNKNEVLKNNLINEIKQEYNIDIAPVFDKNIDIALSLILHDYGNFNISTIDSFFQNIIRSFAKELDLPLGLKIELNTDNILDKCVESLMTDYADDKGEITNWLEFFALSNIENDNSWKIDKAIRIISQQVLKEEYINDATDFTFDAKSLKEFVEKMKDIKTEYELKLKQFAKKIDRIVEENNINYEWFSGGKKSYFKSFVNKLKNQNVDFNATILGFLDGSKSITLKGITDAEKTQTETCFTNQIQPILIEIQHYNELHIQWYNTSNLILKNIYSTALLQYITDKLKEIRTAENLFLISDTNHFLCKVSELDEVPFIYEKTGIHIQYILLDEFQDTSKMQWKALAPLALEILSKLNGLLLIVGDPKQSIYRWRNGSMELINGEIANELGYHWDNKIDIALEENYRSAKEIVEFNNAIMQSILKNVQEQLYPKLQLSYQKYSQNIVHKNKNGYVEFTFFESPKKDKNTNDDDEMNTKEKTFEKILFTIHENLKTHTYKDIAILFRSNKEGAAIANLLKENNIPVLSFDSLLLENNTQIKLLIAAIEWLYKKEIFYTIKFNYWCAIHQNKIIDASIFNKNSTLFFEEKYTAFQPKNVAKLYLLPLYDLVIELCTILELDKNINDYVLRFQDIVLNFKDQQNKAISALDFLDFWETKKAKFSILPPANINAIQLYSIHKSKGLQFPIVIIPFADFSFTNGKNTLWMNLKSDEIQTKTKFLIPYTEKANESFFAHDYNIEKENILIENINMLYVAFTRAEEQLYVFSKKLKDDKPKDDYKNIHTLLLHSLKNISLNNFSFTENNFSYGLKNNLIKTKKDIFLPTEFEAKASINFREKLILESKFENNAIIIGNILHDVLATTNSKIDVQNKLQKINVSYNFTGTELQEIEKKIIAIFEIFEKQNWIENQYLHQNETTIIYNGKELRPDKVLIKNNECIIIDYKTGIEKKAHQQQILEYVNAYKKLNFENVSAYLLYTETNILEKIII